MKNAPRLTRRTGGWNWYPDAVCRGPASFVLLTLLNSFEVMQLFSLCAQICVMTVSRKNKKAESCTWGKYDFVVLLSSWNWEIKRSQPASAALFYHTLENVCQAELSRSSFHSPMPFQVRMCGNMRRVTGSQKNKICQKNRLVIGITALKTLQRIHGTARVSGPRDSGLLSTATETICRVHMPQHTAYRHSLSS